MVLQWFQSYLAGRHQYVRTSSSASSPTLIVCGVPQGSVLGAILFLLYTADLVPLIQSHGLCPHLYADDTQIYGSWWPSASLELQNNITSCVDDVASWMRSNRLQLNTAKTEILWSATGRRSHQLPQSPLQVGNDEVMPAVVVRDCSMLQRYLVITVRLSLLQLSNIVYLTCVVCKCAPQSSKFSKNIILYS